jgi:hypothetical protein
LENSFKPLVRLMELPLMELTLINQTVQKEVNKLEGLLLILRIRKLMNMLV